MNNQTRADVGGQTRMAPMRDLAKVRHEAQAVGASLILPIATSSIPEMGLSGMGIPLTKTNVSSLKAAHAWLNGDSPVRGAADLSIALSDLFPLFVGTGDPSRIAPTLLRSIIGGYAVVSGISRGKIARLAGGDENVQFFLTAQVRMDGRIRIILDEHSFYPNEEIPHSGTSLSAWCDIDLVESPGHCLAMAKRNGAYFSI